MPLIVKGLNTNFYTAMHLEYRVPFSGCSSITVIHPIVELALQDQHE